MPTPSDASAPVGRARQVGVAQVNGAPIARRAPPDRPANRPPPPNALTYLTICIGVHRAELSVLLISVCGIFMSARILNSDEMGTEGISYFAPTGVRHHDHGTCLLVPCTVHLSDCVGTGSAIVLLLTLDDAFDLFMPMLYGLWQIN